MFKQRDFDGTTSIERKSELRLAAKLEWPFLQNLDLSDVESDVDLALLIHIASGRTFDEAVPLVRDWMERNRIRYVVADRSHVDDDQHDWENEGGAAANSLVSGNVTR